MRGPIAKPPAIRVAGLGKTYRVWQRPSDMILEALALKRRHSEFQALTDISFEVPAGSVTGIMGRNGAGKSTLLRIVAGTLDATAGQVEVNGRISAILELGTGFSPDYTGRENIFLGGMCLGLKHREIKERLDEIVTFAEVGEFIDRPFRTFSTGMQARLTFAVATCVDPDILIIDEALAVGDARFQVKSFDRVREFKRRGKAILLVSHDMNQIASICDRAILLEKGRVVADGNPQKVCNIYHEMLFAPVKGSAAVATLDVEAESLGSVDATDFDSADSGSITLSPAMTDRSEVGATEEYRYGDGAARIVSIRITTPDGGPVSRLRSLQQYHLVCRVKAITDIGPSYIGWLLRDKRGLDLYGWDMQRAKCGSIPPLKAGENHEVTIRFRANLGWGSYFITVGLARDDTRQHHDSRLEVLQIEVEATTDIYTTSIVNLETSMLESSVVPIRAEFSQDECLRKKSPIDAPSACPAESARAAGPAQCE